MNSSVVKFNKVKRSEVKCSVGKGGGIEALKEKFNK